MFGLKTPKLGPKLTYTLLVLSVFTNVSNLAADSSVINNLNVVPSYVRDLDLNAAMIGLNVSLIALGSIVAAPFIGPVLDRWGRINGMAIGAIMACAAIAIAGSATTSAQFAVGRVLLGIGIDFSATAGPLLIMEITPPRRRSIIFSTTTALWPLSGVIFSAVVVAIYDYDTTWVWRGLVLGEILTPLLSLCLLPFVPESPRWLVHKGRETEALEILTRLHGRGNPDDELVKLEFKEICDTLEYEQSLHLSWKGLVSPAPNLRRFSIAVAVAIFYQMSGANNLLYFMTILISTVGIQDTRTILVINTCVGIWNTICVIVGPLMIDGAGRRKTFMFGTGLMAACLLVVGILARLLEDESSTGIAVGGIVVIFLFQLAAMGCWQILGYQYPNEILGFSYRARGVAVSQAIGYAFSFLYTYIFPIAVEKISWRYFIINGCWDILIVIAIFFTFPETRGKTLEEVDQIFDGLVHTHSNVNASRLGVLKGLSLTKTVSRPDEIPLEETQQTVQDDTKKE